jgi:alpha-glucoside transport system substrate-binding protein
VIQGRSREIRITAAVAAVMLVAAACGSGATPAPSAAAPASAAPASAAASAAPASAAAASAAASAAPAPSYSATSISAAQAYAKTLGNIGGSVSVLAQWGGTEQAQFLAMVKPFEDATGVTVNYTGTRDEPAVLTTGIASGQLPDIAGIPGPAQMQQYAAAGKLQDLSTMLDMSTYQSQTPSSLVQLGTVSGKLVGVFLDVSAKGQIWYDPKIVGDLASNPPKTWSDLQTLITQDKSKAQAPWCFSVESGAASGWPATDVLESFVLHTQGPTYYNNWWAGKVKWTDPGMKADWQQLGQMVAQSYGGANRVLTANFANAGDPLFTTPPGCLFLHQASFITGLGAFANQTKLTDYNFFPFPSITAQYAGAVEGGGDLFGAFHNTPQAAALMKYLVSSQAQTLFVGQGEFLSANKGVANYPNAMNQRLGQILSGATSFVFDASDQMPTPMQTAFYQALLKYIQNPGQLDSILQNLDSVQASSYGQ